MSYKYKLSRRLAQIFYSFPALAIVFLFTACGGDEKTSSFGPAIDTTISSIVVTPEKTIAEVGDTIHVTAYGSSETVSNVPVELDWQVTGGSITPEGHFRADAPGTYKVSGWTRNEARVADTVSLTVQAIKDTASLAGPNAPVGFTYLSSRPFNLLGENGWQERDDPWFGIVTDASSPGASSTVGQALYGAGFTGGRGPINTLFDLPQQYDELYLSFWVKFSPNWVGHSSGVNKIFFFWIDQGASVYLSAQGSGTGPMEAQVRLQGVNESPVSRNLQPNVSGAIVRRGSWQRWEVRLKANTPGQADGSAEWWVDGVKAGYYSGINFVDSRSSSFWEQVSWNPTWGGTGGNIAMDQWMRIDDIYVTAR